MKKITLLLLACVMQLGLFAQDVLMFTEGFEGTVNWQIIDADGDGYNWQIMSYSVDQVSAHGGDKLVSSESFSNSAVAALTPDNYLISPDVTGATKVKYWVCAQDADWPSEHYSVMTSSTDMQTTSFTSVFQETMVAAPRAGVPALGTTKVRTLQNTPGGPVYAPQAVGTYYERTVTLPAGTKYVAFRHHNTTDMFRLNLDDISFYTDATGDTYTITATAGAGGSISPSGAVSVGQYSDMEFTITPNSGYAIDSVIVDGNDATAQVFNNTYTFSNVYENHTIHAVFKTSSAVMTNDVANLTAYGKSGMIFIDNTNNVELNRVEVLDLTGRVVYMTTDAQVKEISAMTSGYYLVRITTANGATKVDKVFVEK